MKSVIILMLLMVVVVDSVSLGNPVSWLSGRISNWGGGVSETTEEGATNEQPNDPNEALSDQWWTKLHAIEKKVSSEQFQEALNDVDTLLKECAPTLEANIERVDFQNLIVRLRFNRILTLWKTNRQTESMLETLKLRTIVSSRVLNAEAEQNCRTWIKDCEDMYNAISDYETLGLAEELARKKSDQHLRSSHYSCTQIKI